MAFCTSCGATVNGAFCPQCGTPVSVAASQPATPAPAAMPPVAGPVPPGMPVRRKTSPLVWVLVIVLGIFILGGVAVVGTGMFLMHKARQAGIDPDLWRHNPGLAAAKMAAAVNPNLEIARVNDDAGTITFRDKRSGKETTVTFADARNGRFKFSAEDENGKTATVELGGSASQLPSWIPSYPGSNPQMTVSGSGSDGAGGNFTFSTSDSPARVMEFYRDKAKGLGMTVENVVSGDEGGTMTATDEGSHRSLTVLVGSSSGQTTVNVTYGQK
jgi:hypothetical protein